MDVPKRGPEGPPDLLRHGLLPGSFVPERPQRELRELTRDRPSLIRERSAEVNRLPQTREGANLTRAVVASDVVSTSGREILAVLGAGGSDAAALAQFAKGRLREKIPPLPRALADRLGAHQRFVIAQHLAHLEFLDEAIAQVSKEIAERMRPFAEELARLDTIPGMDRRGAESGTDLSRFPSADHLASWARVVPSNNESAGQPRSGTTRKGDPWRRSALSQAAHAAGRTKSTDLGAQDRRLAARRGKKKAAVAVGHSLLVIADHLLWNKVTDEDWGPHSFDERDREGVKRRLVRRLEDLGDQVTVEPAPAAA